MKAWEPPKRPAEAAMRASLSPRLVYDLAWEIERQSGRRMAACEAVGRCPSFRSTALEKKRVMEEL